MYRSIVLSQSRAEIEEKLNSGPPSRTCFAMEGTSVLSHHWITALNSGVSEFTTKARSFEAI
jgi:hypothetical protein